MDTKHIRRLPPASNDVLVRVRTILKKLYGPRLRGLYLYGSYARGDQAEGRSDIDIAVVLDDFEHGIEESNRLVQAMSELLLEEGVLVSCRPIRERDFKAGQWSLYRNIRREGIPICDAPESRRSPCLQVRQHTPGGNGSMREDEMRALFAQADEDLVLARDLCTRGYHRQATSRAYYAMHAAARAALLSVGVEPGNHRAVIAAVGRRLVKTGRIAAHHQTNLATAFERRLDADYGAPAEIDEHQTAETIKWAQDFIDALKQ